MSLKIVIDWLQHYLSQEGPFMYQHQKYLFIEYMCAQFKMIFVTSYSHVKGTCVTCV